jgi:hypothetical protein
MNVIPEIPIREICRQAELPLEMRAENIEEQHLLMAMYRAGKGSSQDEERLIERTICCSLHIVLI